VLCLNATFGTARAHGEEGGELSDVVADLFADQAPPTLTEPQIATALESAEVSVRRHALAQLLRNRTRAEFALPLLQRLLESPAPPSVAEQNFQRDAVCAASHYGSRARTLSPLLIKLMNDGLSGPVRELSARALGAISPDDPVVIEALAQATAHREEATAVAAIQTLGRLKAASRAAEPALVKALGRDWRQVPAGSYAAYTALGQIETSAPTLTVQAATERLRHLDQLEPAAAAAAFAALQVYGNLASPAEPVVLELLSHSPAYPLYVKAAALYTLGHLGFSSGEEATEMLLHYLEEGDPALVPTIQKTLLHLTPADRAAVMPLARALAQPQEIVRQQAALALAKLGTTAKPAAGALLHAVRELASEAQQGGDVSPLTIHDYLIALISIGPVDTAASETVAELAQAISPLLIKVDEKTATSVRIDIFATLASLGMPAAGALREAVLQQVVQSLQSSDPRLFSSAARAAGALGADAKAAVPQLLRALSGGREAPGIEVNGVYVVPPSTRFEAVRALGKIGSAAVAAIPPLQRIVSGNDALSALLNGEARLALLSIQGRGEKAGN
jgi:hypothetical protein